MKKVLVIVLSLVLCIACFAMPVYADDLVISGPVTSERGFVYECDGNGYIYEIYNYGIVRITITVEGRTTLDSNGNVTGFSCSSCFATFEVISGFSPSELDISAYYINYSVSNNTVKARVYYSVTVEGSTNSGYLNVEMSGL